MPFITQNFLASTIKANGVTLSSSFSYSQLDLQDNSPINVANYNHQQKWTPTDEYILSPEGQLQGGNLVTDGFSGNSLVPGSGFLDLENNGPTNVANYNHQQKWTPTDEFILSPEGSKQGGNLINDGFDGPNNLDLENNGPTNVANYNHQQKWTPTDEYILNPQGQLQGGNLEKQDPYKIDDESIASLNPVINVPSNKHQQIYNPLNQYEDSPQGKLRSPDSSAEKNNFKTSGLDLEDSLAGTRQGGNGGPNRTNAIQSKKAFNSGQYTVTRAGGLGFSGNDAGGSVVTQTLHRYTPTNGYYDTLIGKPIDGKGPYGTNVALPNNADGPYDDTLK